MKYRRLRSPKNWPHVYLWTANQVQVAQAPTANYAYAIVRPNLIYCRAVGTWAWDTRQLDGQPHIMSALGFAMFSRSLYSLLSLWIMCVIHVNQWHCTGKLSNESTGYIQCITFAAETNAVDTHNVTNDAKRQYLLRSLSDGESNNEQIFLYIPVCVPVELMHIKVELLPDVFLRPWQHTGWRHYVFWLCISPRTRKIIVNAISWTRNVSDCDQSNYSSRIIYSCIFTLEPNTNRTGWTVSEIWSFKIMQDGWRPRSWIWSNQK